MDEKTEQTLEQIKAQATGRIIVRREGEGGQRHWSWEGGTIAPVVIDVLNLFDADAVDYEGDQPGDSLRIGPFNLRVVLADHAEGIIYVEQINGRPAR